MHRYIKFLMVALLIMAGAMPAALAQVVTGKNLLMPEITKDWKTLETKNFRIHHESTHKEYAQQMAAIAEGVHDKLSPWLGWQPQEPTEVVLLDTADKSSGSASPLPFNSISIYMLPPVDGELMDHSQWLEMVFTHEYVHILHLDMAFGSPRALRNVFGRSMDLFTLFDFPQLFAPTWVAEGLAVYVESDNSDYHGRLNSAMYEAMMRMEVQRGLRSLTEVSYNSGYRWPYGQAYLYGAYFFKFVEERYGREAVKNYIRVYGSNLIPFRMETRSEQIFKKSADEVWTEFQAYLTQRFAPQLASNQQQNRVTTRTVYDAPYSNTALAAAANGDLYFLHDDASSSSQIRRIRADGNNEAVVDGRGVQEMNWHDAAGLLLSKFAVCDNTNRYADLYQWQPGMSSAKRLTHCGRYVFAAWRPDGKSIAAIQTERGLSRLLLLDATGKKISVLAVLPMGDTLGHIAWSPDGAVLVASIQRKKSGWNLELLHVQNQQWQALTSGSNLVQRPQFSADGKEIYFLSDHGKVWNLRRLNLDSNNIDTLSNTTSAITEAVVMPDKSYRMVEYTPYGTAIVALPAKVESPPGGDLLAGSCPLCSDSVVGEGTNEKGTKPFPLPNPLPGEAPLSNFPPQAGDLLAGSSPLRSDSVVGERTNEKGTKPLMGTNERSAKPLRNVSDYQPYPYVDVKDYSPWHTLKPHSWFPLIDSSADKTSFAGVLLRGSDALNFHQWQAVPLYYYNLRQFGGLANYSFYNNATLSAQRSFFMLGNPDATVRYRGEEARYQALLHHSFNTLNLYLAAGVASEKINIVATQGTVVDLTYNNKITGAIVQYDNSRIYKRSISPVDGRRVQLLGESYDSLGGSDDSGKTVRMDWSEYIALGDNHALHFRVLYAQGDAGIRPYHLGGVSDTLSQIGAAPVLGRRDFPLRGYPSGLAALSGSNIGLATAEWRFPLGYHYDGWFVPPVGVGRESLTLFVDSGDAWNQGQSPAFKTGVGVEWNIEALLGYDLLKLSTTLGFARGRDTGGENRVYLRVLIPFL